MNDYLGGKMKHSCLDISEGNALSALIDFLVTQLSQAQLIADHDAVALDNFHSRPLHALSPTKAECGKMVTDQNGP